MVEKSFWIDGDRFEAVVSPGRTRADISDRKLGKKLILLDRAALEELHALIEEILSGMETD
jgi:hypothetical protein